MKISKILISFFAILVLLFFSNFIKNFKIDASSDTLILQNERHALFASCCSRSRRQSGLNDRETELFALDVQVCNLSRFAINIDMTMTTSISCSAVFFGILV